MARSSTSTVLVAGAMALGLMLAGCSHSTETTKDATSATASTTGAAGGGDFKTLVPTPANTATSKGPDAIADNGIHQYFQVNGVPNDVMAAFKTALEGKGWEVSTIVSSGGGPGGGGGATYVGTHGDAYGVFDGGGYKETTYIDVCTWPSKPANPNCQRGTGR